VGGPSSGANDGWGMNADGTIFHSGGTYPWFRTKTNAFLKENYGITMKRGTEEGPDWGAPKPFFVDNSGRNDIIETKVTFDDVYVYMYVKTAKAITAPDPADPNWMNLLITTNFDATSKTAYTHEGVGLSTTGAQPYFNFVTSITTFENYQFILNRTRDASNGTIALERFTGVGFNDRTKIADVKYELVGNEMNIAISRAALGLDGANDLKFAFKWADNAEEMSNAESWYRTGEIVPKGKLNYFFNIVG